jgi:hypothetical protein
MKAHALALLVLVVVACDKSSTPAPAASASAAPSVPVASAAVTPSVAPSASEAPAVDPAANPKEVMVSIKDVDKEPSKTVKAQLGGSVTLFLPDSAGSSWAVDVADKTLGKAKEETMPGFAPGTNAHQFQWSTKNPLLKAGETHKVTFTNKKAGKTFTLTIEFTA